METNKPMTLEEAKQQTANKDGYGDFGMIPYHLFEEYFTRAAELYCQSQLEALRKENEEQRELIKHQGISILERREKIQSLEAELERVKGIVDLGNQVYQDDVKDLRSQITELEGQLKDAVNKEREAIWNYLRNRIHTDKTNGDSVQVHHIIRATTALESSPEQQHLHSPDMTGICFICKERVFTPEQAEQDCICPPYECLLGKKERCQKPAPEALQQDCWKEIYIDFNDGEGWINFTNRMKEKYFITRK